MNAPPPSPPAAHDTTWIANATQTSGRPPGAVAQSVDKRTGLIGTVSIRVPIGRALPPDGPPAPPSGAAAPSTGQHEDTSSEVPIIGDLLYGTLAHSGAPFAIPFLLSYDIAHSSHVNLAAVDLLNRKLKAAGDAAAYAQVLVAFAPQISTVGPGLSASVAVGLALASGMPIDMGLRWNLFGTIGGGPIAQVAFVMGSTAGAGNSLHEILNDSLVGLTASGVPSGAVSVVMSALRLADQISRGEEINQVTLDTAFDGLSNIPGFSPATAKLLATSLQMGVAVGHAQHLQHHFQTIVPEVLDALIELGENEADINPIIDAGSTLVDEECEEAFYAAVGLMQQHAGPVEITAARHAFEGEGDLVAFDIALSIHIGEVTHKTLPPELTFLQLAGYLLVKGMRGATEAQRVAMMEEIKDHPEARSGAVLALKEVSDTRGPDSPKLKEALNANDQGAHP